MITTGDDKIKSNNSKLYITNVINSSNIEKAQVAYSNATIYIDNKFELPRTKSENTETGNEQIDSYVSNLIKINEIQNGIAETIRQKIKFWFKEWKFRGNLQKERIFIDKPLSKHEWVAIAVLNNLGASLFVISDTQITYKLPGINYGDINCDFEELDDDGTELNYKATSAEVSAYTKNEQKEISTVHDIINEFCSNVYVSSAIVNGWTDNKEDSLALSELVNNETSGYVVIKNKFEKPSIADSQIIGDYGDYASIKGSLRVIFSKLSGDSLKNFDIQSILQSIHTEFGKFGGTYNLSQLRNKLIVAIGIIAKLLRGTGLEHIVFFGVPDSNDKIVLEILRGSNQFNLLIINSDLSKAVAIDNIKSINFDRSVDTTKFMSLIESNNVAKTLAASVESSVNSTLFSNDTIGLYKPGQLDYASCIRLKTTFDETNNWLAEDAFIRPGYGTDGNRVVLPTIFKIVMGVKDDMSDTKSITQSGSGTGVGHYIHYISKQFNGNSILFRSFRELTASIAQDIAKDNYTFVIKDATNTRDYLESKHKLFENGVLNKKAIMSSRFYKYGLLSENKQYMILDVIEKVITEGYIDYSKYRLNYEQYTDAVLSILLNMNISIVNKIHAFNFHGKVPRIIIVSADDNESALKNLLTSAILLCALNLLGFDILVYVPNAYNTLNSLYTDKFNADIHVIGDPVLDYTKLSAIPMGIRSIPINSDPNKKDDYTHVNMGSNASQNTFVLGGNTQQVQSVGNKKPGFFKRLFK